MPAPSIIYTIIDKDGDEFPVRLWGQYETVVQERQAALNELERLVQDGSWRPEFPVTIPQDRREEA